MNISTTIDDLGRAIGVTESEGEPRWFERLVRWRLRRSVVRARDRRSEGAYAEAAPADRARSLVRFACIKAAVTGALSGAACSVAEVVTAETEGAAGLVAIPTAAATVAGELFLRGIVHVDLACELAEVFDLGLKLEDHDMVRLFSLVFAGARRPDERSDDLGRSLVDEVTSDKRQDIVERAGHAVVGESVLKNIVPFVGILSSAASNVAMTYRLGVVLRRTFRYERAIIDAFEQCRREARSITPLLVEGLWFVFTADGHLSAEEIACLAQRLDDLSEQERRDVIARFTADESDWLSRLGQVPEGARGLFMRVLEIAVALDKAIELPETKILRRVAQAFGRTYDPKELTRIVDAFDRTGTLHVDRATP